MATTQNTYTGNNSTTEYSFTFPYLEESDVKVSLDGVVQATTEYSFANATTISFDTAPGTDVAIRIFRETDTDSARTTFFAGSAIRAQDLNDNNNQLLYSTQETINRRVDSTGGTMTGNLTLNDADIVFEGATADDFETTLSVVDPTADRTIDLPNQSGTLPVLAVASTTQITSTPEELNLLDGSTAGTVTASNAVVVDSNSDITGFRNITLTGELDAATLDVSGDIDVDGTANLDAVDIDGAVDIAGEVAMNSNKITGLGTPTADGDAATKLYVDNVALAAIPDSNKGDITVTSSGTTWTIDNDAVTYAKIQNVATANRVLGSTSADGIVSEVQVATDMVADDAVTYAKMQNVSATDRLLGRSTAGAGDVEEITCTAAGRALLDDADASAQRTTLGLAIGTDVQAFDADNAVTDTAQTYTATISATERTITASDFDLSTGNYWTCGAIAIPNPTNQTAGTAGLIRVTAAPTSFGSEFDFPGGAYTAPTTFPAVVPFFVQASGTILLGNFVEGIA